MIVNKKGHYKTHRTEEEIVEMMKRDLENMTPEERDIFNTIIAEIKSSGSSAFMQVSQKLTFIRQPVSIDTFLSDPLYLGKETLNTLYPEWKKEIKKIVDGKYQEVVFGGSLGAGKSTVATILLVWMVYNISCIKNPHGLYGILPTDKISFPVISIKQSVADEVVYKAAGIFANSDYFKINFRAKFTVTNGIQFPNNIEVPMGMSRPEDSIGLNAFGAIIDESNFFKNTSTGPVRRDVAKEIYDSIKGRIVNRFMRDGRIPGMLVMVSSKGNADSFTEKRILEAVNDSTVYVVENASYDVVPKGRYSSKTFRVAVGNESTNSRILSEDEPDPEGMLVIEVPVDLRSLYEADIDKSIRDHSGVAITSITPFITNRKKIIEAVDPSRSHPFSHYVWKQDVAGKVKWEMIAKKGEDGAWRPLLNPSAPRVVHLDLSKNKDATGIAIGHVGGWKQVQRLGSDTVELAPIFVADFILKIEAPTGGDIIYSEIRKLIYEFSNHGFFIKKVTADQFQSAAVLQTLSQQGFTTSILSVDIAGPYDAFKLALNEDRVSYYKYDPMMSEMRTLEKNWKTGKVDHPQHGSKDAADAFCGVISSLITISEKMAPSLGGSYERTNTENFDDETWVIEGSIPIENSNKDNNNGDWKNEVDRKGISTKTVDINFVIG